jgi:hypothetical protein
VCPVCLWEDDGDDLDRVGGPNGDLTLSEARCNHAAVCACTETWESGVHVDIVIRLSGGSGLVRLVRVPHQRIGRTS